VTPREHDAWLIYFLMAVALDARVAVRDLRVRRALLQPRAPPLHFRASSNSNSSRSTVLRSKTKQSIRTGVTRIGQVLNAMPRCRSPRVGGVRVNVRRRCRDGRDCQVSRDAVPFCFVAHGAVSTALLLFAQTCRRAGVSDWPARLANGRCAATRAETRFHSSARVLRAWCHSWLCPEAAARSARSIPSRCSFASTTRRDQHDGRRSAQNQRTHR
jgi:hypothetical protein